MYHYEACGLPNVYLKNGYTAHKTRYGEGMSIEDVEGLHGVLADAIVSSADALSGDEFRFLRRQLELSQAGLAELLGCDEQSVARWEKGKAKKIDAAAERLLRIIYRGETRGDKKLKSVVEMLRKIEASPAAAKKFIAQEKNNRWHTEEKIAAAG